jgi:maltose O-acetyltransferase
MKTVARRSPLAAPSPRAGEVEFVPAVPTGSRLGRPWRRLLRRLHGWPNLEGLQRDGLRLGRNVFVAGGTHLDPDFCWLIDIGDDTVISLGVMVLAHDASTRRHTGYTRVARVRIGARVFVGAHAIVLPGVTIGDDAVVGAGSLVRHDVPPGTVVAGNPARPLGSTEAYAERHRARMAGRPRWPKRGWTVAGGIDDARKREMREALRDGEAYVE